MMSGNLPLKLFIILEEFKYKNSLSGEFLKLLGGERLLTSKKYSKNHISLENLKDVIGMLPFSFSKILIIAFMIAASPSLAALITDGI